MVALSDLILAAQKYHQVNAGKKPRRSWNSIVAIVIRASVG